MDLEVEMPGFRQSLVGFRAPTTERHLLHWVIKNGTFVAELTCLHATLPSWTMQCGKQFAAEYPELFLAAFSGPRLEVRDGIIISYWTGGHSTYYSDENEAEFMWEYQKRRSPVELQRHSVRYIFSDGEIVPVFECLHTNDTSPENPCHADVWREEVCWFPEYVVGPVTQAMSPGVIVSWWPEGQYEEDRCPFWGYEHNTDNQSIAMAIAEHQARNAADLAAGISRTKKEGPTS